MKKKNVAVFGLGYDQRYGINELSKNFNIIGFDNKKNIKNIKIDKIYNVDWSNKKKILEIIKKEEIKNIFSFSTEAPIQLIGWLNTKLKNNHYNLATSKLGTNKFLFRKKMRENKIFSPEFYKISKKKNLQKIKYPIICKPLMNSASRGVFVAKNRKEFIKKLEQNDKYYKNFFLAESFFYGQHFSIDGWFCNNEFHAICLSKNYKSKKYPFTNQKILINYQNPKLLYKATALAKRCCIAIKADKLPIHLEFIKYKNKLVPIDMGIRGAGSKIYSKYLSKIINKSTSKIQIDLQLNNRIKKFKSNEKNFLIYFLIPQKKIQFKNIDYKILEKSPYEFEFKILKKKGELIAKFNNNYDRVGIIYFYLKNLKNINKQFNKIDRIVEKIKIN
jgi:hypothetical protein